jgi:hypothetical protein
MRSRLAKALILALLAGPMFTFVNEIIWTHGAVKYDPPISQSEIEQWKKLPMAEMETKLAQRRVSLSRKQWLADSVGYSYFWKGLADSSSDSGPWSLPRMSGFEFLRAPKLRIEF